MIAQQLLLNKGDRNFAGDIEQALRQVEAGDWAGAEASVKSASELWAQSNYIVAVKYAETDYTLLQLTLLRFRAAIEKRNAEESAKEGVSCLYLFQNITSIAPKP